MNLIDRLLEMTQYGLLASFGAIANYVYATFMQGKPFVWKMFFANIILAFFAGNMAGEFIAPDTNYRDGIIMACGYCAFPLLAIFEAVVLSKFKEFLTSIKLSK